MLPEIALTAYLVITLQLREIVMALVIVIFTVVIAWLCGNFLIVRKIKALTQVSERLSSGD
ncbi:MAG TPA: hypothetical protein VMT46_06490, partial [Anaerolineaceae bacterium]|nr:hypothetical protein [Anaerolineaceae bacterium]